MVAPQRYIHLKSVNLWMWPYLGKGHTAGTQEMLAIFICSESPTPLPGCKRHLGLQWISKSDPEKERCKTWFWYHVDVLRGSAHATCHPELPALPGILCEGPWAPGQEWTLRRLDRSNSQVYKLNTLCTWTPALEHHCVMKYEWNEPQQPGWSLLSLFIFIFNNS